MRAWLTRHSLPLRIALSAGLMAFLLYNIDVAGMGRVLAGARPEFVLLALGVIALERLVMAWKWQLLLAAKACATPLLRMLKIVYLSNFIGTFLPSSLGVDVVRSYSLYRHGTNLSESVSSVLVDKLLSLLAAMVVPVTVVLSLPEVVEPAVRGAILVMSAGFAAALLLGLNRQFIHALLRHAHRLPGPLSEPVLWSRVAAFYGVFHAYGEHRSVLVRVFLASLVFQALRILGVVALGAALGLDAGIFAYLVFVPVIIVLTMIPISVGGIGVREGAFVYFFTSAGVPAESALALSILLYLVSLVSVLPGGIIFAMEGAGRRITS